VRKVGQKPYHLGAGDLHPYFHKQLTPRLDVGIQLRIGEFEFYIFNTTCLDVLEVDLRI
jgi:hypothetical protein